MGSFLFTRNFLLLFLNLFKLYFSTLHSFLDNFKLFKQTFHIACLPFQQKPKAPKRPPTKSKYMTGPMLKRTRFATEPPAEGMVIS